MAPSTRPACYLTPILIPPGSLRRQFPVHDNNRNSLMRLPRPGPRRGGTHVSGIPTGGSHHPSNEVQWGDYFPQQLMVWSFKLKMPSRAPKRVNKTLFPTSVRLLQKQCVGTIATAPRFACVCASSMGRTCCSSRLYRSGPRERESSSQTHHTEASFPSCSIECGEPSSKDPTHLINDICKFRFALQVTNVAPSAACSPINGALARWKVGFLMLKNNKN